MTEAHGCEQLAQSGYAAAQGRGSNPQPLDRKSVTVPLRHPQYINLHTLCAAHTLTWHRPVALTY